jgi:peptidoglycan/xylan/chitin deacetylase (PgdA/CDA1 family)
MRLMAKRALELGLCRSGLPGLLRRRRRHDVLVLAYHNVVPDDGAGRGDTSLHIGQDRLHRQLRRLSRTHEFIGVDRIFERGRGKPRVAVTFDDAYGGAIRLGVEVLRELDVPATVFVTPGCLGGQAFWWDLLAQGREVEPATRELALSALEGKGSSILAWAQRQQDPGDLPAYWRTATEAELDEALGFDGLTLGSHTWSHPNLAALEGAELVEELARPIDWLRQRYAGRVAEWVSYPYGRWSESVAGAARRAGYRGGFRIEGGWIQPGYDPFGLPRFNVPAGLSVEGLELRASGIMR